MEIEDLLDGVRQRFLALPANSCARESFVAHLRSLARVSEPLDYPDAGVVEFPQSITVAFAVCHPECGTREFIVEGSTQECQHCGGLMFRAEGASYALVSASSAV